MTSRHGIVGASYCLMVYACLIYGSLTHKIFAILRLFGSTYESVTIDNLLTSALSRGPRQYGVTFVMRILF